MTSTIPPARRLAPAFVAAALGLGVGTFHLLRPVPAPGVDVQAWSDATFAPLRPRLSQGERVPLLMPGDDPDVNAMARNSAQYALLPALVVPIELGPCIRRDAARPCELGQVDELAVAGMDAAAVDPILSAFGLVSVERQGELGVYVRRRR